MTDQRTYLAITPKGEAYFQHLLERGFVNIDPQQRVEWNILHDLMLQGVPVSLSEFLQEGRDTILGRTFSLLSERAHGRLAIEGYGHTLHELIKQGYIKAYRPSAAGKEV
jgi:hypothetical protein